MTKTMLVKEAAKLWGLTERRVSGLCREGKINGAKKQGKSWVIPVDAEKPVDNRIKTGAYKKSSSLEKLPLPIGVSDYCLASSEYYYIDKTMMIKDFIDSRPMVSLFTRPRRFGKTLNMDMFRVFFEKSNEDTSIYFKNKNIWKCGKKYREFQGKYPVIYITFKDIKKDTWEETYERIVQLITLEYKRHFELKKSTKIQDSDYYHKVIEGSVESVLFDSSLYMLSKMLHEHHGIAPIIIIDEYDTPIQQGYTKGFYDEAVLFIRNLFSGGLKDNKHLSYGFLTGILRVAKESIFSGLNNIEVNSILEDKYSEYFGFTSDEVKEMARYYNVEDRFEEICQWYDGYKFGSTEIFNPWSVINYFNNACNPRAYWVATSGNDIIAEVLSEATPEIFENLNILMSGKSFISCVDTDVIYPEIKNDASSVYSFLLVCGYLKIVKSDLSYDGEYMCQLALPNKEIKLVYNKEILQRFKKFIQNNVVMAIKEAIFTGNSEMLKIQIEKILYQSASYYDVVGENFYHGFMLGLCATFGQAYLASNRESGKGRYDIQLMPHVENMPGILIEIKTVKKCDENKLKEVAQNALQQIIDNKYDTEMIGKGVKVVYKYGVAFSGKNVEIAMG